MCTVYRLKAGARVQYAIDRSRARNPGPSRTDLALAGKIYTSPLCIYVINTYIFIWCLCTIAVPAKSEVFGCRLGMFT